MKNFDLEAAKRGAAVCMRDGRAANVLSFNSHVLLCGSPEPVVVEYINVGRFAIGTFSDKGEWVAGGECKNDLMMCDDDYLEKLERGEYALIRSNSTQLAIPSNPMELTRREWFAGMAMAGEIAGFLSGDCGVKDASKGVPATVTEDAVVFADALIAELDKTEKMKADYSKGSVVINSGK